MYAIGNDTQQAPMALAVLLARCPLAHAVRVDKCAPQLMAELDALDRDVPLARRALIEDVRLTHAFADWAQMRAALTALFDALPYVRRVHLASTKNMPAHVDLVACVRQVLGLSECRIITLSSYYASVRDVEVRQLSDALQGAGVCRVEEEGGSDERQTTLLLIDGAGRHVRLRVHRHAHTRLEFTLLPPPPVIQ